LRLRGPRREGEGFEAHQGAGRHRLSLHRPRPQNHLGARALRNPFEVELTLADKRRVRSKIYLAEVEAEGRRGPALVAELDVPTPLLGVHALKTLGLKPDPLTGRLEVIGPEGGYLL